MRRRAWPGASARSPPPSVRSARTRTPRASRPSSSPTSCTDGTADIARSWPGVRLLHTQDGCVGAARATGARHLLARWWAQGVPLAAAWIANTDADSVVPYRLAHDAVRGIPIRNWLCCSARSVPTWTTSIRASRWPGCAGTR